MTIKKSRFALHLTQLNKSPSAKKEGFAESALKAGAAYRAISQSFPSLPSDTHFTLTKVLEHVFAKAQGASSYTPFKSTPITSLTYPAHVLDFLLSSGAVMPSQFEGDKGATRLSLNALADLSNTPKSSLSGVNKHQQHMTIEGMEGWRLALAKIGRANEDNEQVAPLAKLADPAVYLNELLEQWSSLTSPLPIKRVFEWAKVYSGLTPERINELIEQARPTFEEYIGSMLLIWREEVNQGLLESYADKHTFIDVLNTRTASRRISRGFHDMISCIHVDMSPFNSRIKYPKSNYHAYKVRYGSPMDETGLTSSILMAYCFFLGINPVSMLHWLATNESRQPGNYTLQYAMEVDEFMSWRGVIAPHEYQKFYDEVHRLGLVSDQNRWALQLASPVFVFKNYPDEETLKSRLGNDALNLGKVVSDYAMSLPVPVGARVVGEAITPYGMAAMTTNVLAAHNDLGCLSLVSDGEVASFMIAAKRDEEADKRYNMTEEEFNDFMRKKVKVKGKMADYSRLVLEGKEAAPSPELDLSGRDCSDSYHCAGAPDVAKFGQWFYNALASIIEDSQPKRAEVDDGIAY